MSTVQWPSLTVLNHRCIEWFEKKFGHRPWFPSVLPEPFKKNPPVTDVVLVGRLYDELLETQSWPGERFRLWAMGSAAANARKHIAAIPEGDISFLPRYELFPMAQVLHPFPGEGVKWSLVYSGRLTEDKGFGFFLKVASSLQTDFREDVQPIVYGLLQKAKTESDKEETKRLQKLAGSLPWNSRPELWLNLSSEEWIQKPQQNPILFNPSVFLNDDFGVSVAQAQESGWPVLISQWGGHLDAVGPNCRQFEVNREQVMDSSLSSVKSFTENLLSIMRGTPRPSISLPTNTPRVLNRDDLAQIKSNLVAAGIVSQAPWPRSIKEKTAEIFAGKF